MKKWLISLLFLFSGISNAGWMEDSWKAGSAEEMCDWASKEIGYAIDRRLHGVPLEIRDSSELASQNRPAPLDALYVSIWNQLDETDKAFYTRFIKLGYSIAERKLKEVPLATFPKDFGEEYNQFMASCHTSKNGDDLFQLIKAGSTISLTEEEATKLILGASNANLGKEPIGSAEAKYQYCEELSYDLNLIGRFISEGAPEQDVLSLLERSKEVDITDARYDRLKRQIPEAYALTTPFVDWAKQEFSYCSE